MRRPGFLGETDYWFGNIVAPTYPRRNHFGENPCIVCKNGSCTNICTKEQQLQRIKQKHKKLRTVAAKTQRFEITSSTNIAAFALRSGENRNARLQRLAKEGLYVPGAVMSTDYANLVNYGTTDKLKIEQMKQALSTRLKVAQAKRYKTTDMKKIVEIEKQKTKQKEDMWQRVYGTKDPDKIYRLPESVRKRKCDADEECVRIRQEAQLFERT